MVEFGLIVLLVLALSLLIAGLALRKTDVLLALVLGLLPLLIMQVAFRWSTNAGIQTCMQSACASAGLPADCNVAEFGCSEWSGLNLAMYTIAGVAQLILFSIGFGVMLIIHARRRSSAAAPHPLRNDQTAA
jgi:hypothetical protein